MNEPKKANLLIGKSKEDKNAENEEKGKKRVTDILSKYNEREEEYKRVGEKRADEDKKRLDEWKNKSGYYKSSINISMFDNERYDIIRRKLLGNVRMGYRHVLLYGLKQLERLSDQEVIESILDIDSDIKKREQK